MGNLNSKLDFTAGFICGIIIILIVATIINFTT